MGSVNRLSTASETGQSFTYAYDRQGNRWGTLPTCTPTSTTTCQYTFSGNKITNAGITYDLAGNVTYDGFHSYTYDFEGRILKVDSGTTTYSYNALGQRVAKVVSGTEGDFVLDQAGHAITGRISSPTHPWYLSEVYAGNMHVATYANGTTAFPHTNWLGTVMASTGPTGSTIKTCSGYLPFGDGSNCTGSDGSSLGFTGLWSDSETLLDNTPNRNYQSLAGRWTTPDPAGTAAVDVTDPQTWNRYAYVANNPLSYIDPLGLNRAGPGQCSDGNGLCADEGGGADPSTIDGGEYIGLLGSPIFGTYWNDGWHTYIGGFFGGQGQSDGPCYYALANPCGGAANSGTPQPQQPQQPQKPQQPQPQRTTFQTVCGNWGLVNIGWGSFNLGTRFFILASGPVAPEVATFNLVSSISNSISGLTRAAVCP